MAKSDTSPKTLSIDDAASLGRKEKFFSNVRRRITPRLIADGKLHGKKVGAAEHVVIDADFERIMGFGIEAFTYSQQGWTFIAVRAPIDDVARVLQGLRGVSDYQAAVAVEITREKAGIQPVPDRRHVFLVKMRNSDWSVLIQTVHWFQDADALLACVLAVELSTALATQAVAAWDDDFSGTTAMLFDKGKHTASIGDESEFDDLYLYFYDHEISVPECFIASDGKTAALLVEKPALVERADYAVIAVPEESQSNVPHVFEKLGAMAEAISGDFDDEEAFLAHARDGLMARVEGMVAVRAAGKGSPNRKKRK